LTWAQVKALGTTVTAGVIIKRNSGASYHIAQIAGTPGVSEPAFSDTPGSTVIEGTLRWYCIGLVGSFPAWGAPHARLANAYANTWGAAGHKFWIADNHAETQAGITLAQPVSTTTLTTAICVDRTAALPPVEANYNTGASISTTSNQNLAFTGGGNLTSTYHQGILFSAGTGGASSANITTATAASNYIFKDCVFALGITAGGSAIFLGPSTLTVARVFWDNCKVQFAATSHSITLQNVNFEWRNTPSALQGTVPAVLLLNPTNLSLNAILRGVDLSALNTQLIQNNPGSAAPLVLEDCKVHSSLVRMNTVLSGYGSMSVITVRCDSGATNYKSTRDEYAGSQVTETSITRVGGATDGTTPTSDKIVTNSQATLLTPFRMLPLAIWNNTTGADVTVTVYGTVNSASLPLNDELWMDVQYLGSSGSPIASFKTTCKSHPLAAGAAVASDGSTWNGGGSGAGWSPFKLVATLTSPQPQMKGYVYVSARAAKASTTYYVDPQITLT
jgi:hypothetical protein